MPIPWGILRREAIDLGPYGLRLHLAHMSSKPDYSRGVHSLRIPYLSLDADDFERSDEIIQISGGGYPLEQIGKIK